MAENVARSFKILELLARHPHGLALSAIADSVGIARSVAYRLLRELEECRYAVQVEEQGKYRLTTRLASVGLSYLSEIRLTSTVQPILDELARQARELVLLSVAQGDGLVWIAKSQGVTEGLRYDQPLGHEVSLASTATGFCWLSGMTEERAVAIASVQGIPPRRRHGRDAPDTIQSFLEVLRLTRRMGYAFTKNTSVTGLAGLAVPVTSRGSTSVAGVLTISGPELRFSDEIVASLLPIMRNSAQEIGLIHDIPLDR